MIIRRSIVASVALAAALFTITPRLRAEPSAADKETARSLVDDGDKKVKAHDLAGALKSYKTAHEIMNVPTTGLEVAKTQEALGQLLEARDTALAITRIPRTANEPSVFGDARAAADALAARIGPRIPAIVITLQPAAPGAKIELDGVVIPAALIGEPRKANPGGHRIVVTADGFKTVTVDVLLREGETKPTPITLQPGSGEAEPVPVGSAPGGAGTSPASDTGGKKNYTLAIVGFSVGGAGLIFGTITGIMSLSATSAAKNGCKNNVCPAANASDASRSKTMAALSDVGLGLAVAGTAVGVVGLVIAKPSSSGSASLYLSPTTAGFAGTF